MQGAPFKRLMLVIVAITIIAAVQRAAFATTMSSTNYAVQGDSLNFGGGYSSSTNYVVQDTLGDLATGEDLSSSNYLACVGFLCAADAPFLTFSVKQGTSSPGTASAGVAFGTLTPGSVASSDGSTINSIFITIEGVVSGGTAVTVISQNAALERVSSPSSTIDSATANLGSVSSGYGLCVETATQTGGTSLTKSAPYNGTCDKSTNHNVGIVDTSVRNILTTSGSVTGGTSEVLVKTKASVVTDAGADYTDTLTFIATGVY